MDTPKSSVEFSEQDLETLKQRARALREACQAVMKAIAEIIKPIVEAITNAFKGATRWLLEWRLTRRLGRRPAAWLAQHWPWRFVPKRYLWRWARAQLME